MNKKDIAAIRKQFKLDNDLLKIHDIYNVYIRQESSDIYHEESHPFEMLEREQQELFLTNFKKVLTGKPDVKLFQVRFQAGEGNTSRTMLHEGMRAQDVGEWKENMLHIVERMFSEKQYDKDVVVTFIRGEYFRPTKRNSEESEISDRDEVYTNPFILCSMNKTEQPKRSLVFDFIEREFKSSISVDSIINLKAPISGFLYPAFTDFGADVNHVLYAAGKANEPDFDFIERVLQGEDIITAEEDKAVFEEVVKEVAGDTVDTNTLATVYEEIHHMLDEEEEEHTQSPTLDYRDVERVLKASGVQDVDAEKVEEAFKTVIDDGAYELKASNIVPNYNSKSIKIKTKVANISVSPQDLRYIKQVNYGGKNCLLIEVEEDTMIEGFKIISEQALN